MMSQKLQEALEAYEIDIDDFRESYRNALNGAKDRLDEADYNSLLRRLEETESASPWKVVAWVGIQNPPLNEDPRFAQVRRLLREKQTG